MGAVILGVDAPQVAVVAPAVNAGVAVEHFLPVTSRRQTDAIGNPEDRGEIENNQQPARQVAALPDCFTKSSNKLPRSNLAYGFGVTGSEGSVSGVTFLRLLCSMWPALIRPASFMDL